MIKVVPFASPLTHAREHRQTSVLLGDIVDQFHHVHGLADTGTTEETDLAALGKGADQVNHFDAGLKQLHRGRKVRKLGRWLVNGAPLIRTNRSCLIDWAAQHVHNPTQGRWTNRDRNRRTRRIHRHSAAQAIGRTHGNGTNHAITKLLLNFESQTGFNAGMLRAVIEIERLIDGGQTRTGKLDIDHSADALNNVTLGVRHLGNLVTRNVVGSGLSDSDGGAGRRGVKPLPHPPRFQTIPW